MVFAVGLESLRKRKCEQNRDGFAKSTENELPVDDMPEQFKCRSRFLVMAEKNQPEKIQDFFKFNRG